MRHSLKKFEADDRVTTATWLRQVVAALSAVGLDGAGLCRRAGLDPALLQSNDARFPNAVIERMWELALQDSGNPAIGVLAAQAFQPAALDVMGFAMMSSPDLRGAVERAVRYADIVSNASSGRLSSVPGGQRFEILTRFGHTPPPRQGRDFVLLSMLRFLRWIAGRELRPLAVEFAHVTPANPQAYADAFGSALRFGAPAYALLLSDDDLNAPLVTSNPLLAELHDRYVQERMRSLREDELVAQLRRLLVQALPDGEPSRTRMARQLGIGERTLQRRLGDVGSSFHALLEQTRQALAEGYLKNDQVSLGEVGYLLGYADQTSFARAARRWFGISPRQYRAGVQPKAAAPPVL